MAGDAQLLLWIAGVHLVGLGCVALLLIPALRENPAVEPRRSDGESDDGWGHGPKAPPPPPERPRGGIPLPDAVPSRVRFREPGRLADRLPDFQRRPAREPAPDPSRTPSRSRASSLRRRA